MLVIGSKWLVLWTPSHHGHFPRISKVSEVQLQSDLMGPTSLQFFISVLITVEQSLNNPLSETFLFSKKVVSYRPGKNVLPSVKLFLNLNLCGVHLDHLASTTGVLFRSAQTPYCTVTDFSSLPNSLSWKKSLNNKPSANCSFCKAWYSFSSLVSLPFHKATSSDSNYGNQTISAIYK